MYTIDKEELYLFLRDEILAYYRNIYLLKKKSNIIKVHPKGKGIVLGNYVTGLLFIFARNKNFFPLPEYQPYDNNRQRIDMLWVTKDGKQVAAFEIDQTIYPKSISKLSSFDSTCGKFIVSIGSGDHPLPANLLQNTGIELLDITQVSLGIAQYFKGYTTYSRE